MNSLSSHVLDTTIGKPAAGIEIELTLPSGLTIDAITDEDGRCNYWQGAEIKPGQYRIRFLTENYLQAIHDSCFYPFVDVTFNIEEKAGHHHIPLLISPFGFSSYRGS